MRIFFYAFAISLLSLNGYAKIIKYQLLNSQKEIFSFKEVCADNGVTDAPLIEVKTASSLDCMTKETPIRSFCLKKMKNNSSFIRARYDLAKNEIYCQSADRVILKYQCSKKTMGYCQNDQIGCDRLRNILAQNLSLIGHSIHEEVLGEKTLSCYFSSSSYVDSKLND